MARHEETLSHALRNIIADLDEAYVRLATDPNADDRGIDCLMRARKGTNDILETLLEDVQMRTLP